MNRPASLILAAAACLALAACSSSTPATITATPVAATSPATSATPTVASTPTSSSPADDGVLALGHTADISGGEADVTVYHYKQPVASGAPSPDQHGYVWAAIDVKVCVHQAATLSMSPWTLVYADDTDAEPSDVGYSSFPAPAYTFGDKPVKAGRCLRGWITFPVPKSKRPTMVEYTLSDGTVVDWKA